MVPTFQLSHGGISQALLAERRRCLLALPPARGVLAARQCVPHVGVGDENSQAGIGQWDKDGLQGPAARAQRGLVCLTPLPAPAYGHPGGHVASSSCLCRGKVHVV